MKGTEVTSTPRVRDIDGANTISDFKKSINTATVTAANLPQNDLRKALNITFKLMERVGELILDCCEHDHYGDKTKRRHLQTYVQEHNMTPLVCTNSAVCMKGDADTMVDILNDIRVEKTGKQESNQSVYNDRSSFSGSDDNFMSQSTAEEAKILGEDFCSTPLPVTDISVPSPTSANHLEEDIHDNQDIHASLHAYSQSSDTSPTNEVLKSPRCDLTGRTSTSTRINASAAAYGHGKSTISQALGEVKHNSRPHNDLRRWRFTSTDRLNALIDECERQLNGRKLYVCKFCGKVYEIKSSMRYHMKIIHLQMHLRTSEMQCRICGKQFTCVSAVNRHQSKCIQSNDAGNNLSRNNKAYFIPSIINSPAMPCLSDTLMSNTVVNSNNNSLSTASTGKTQSIFSPFSSSQTASADNNNNSNSTSIGQPGISSGYPKLHSGPFVYPALSDTPSSVRVAAAAAAAAALSNMISQGTVDSANAFHAPLQQFNGITSSSQDAPRRSVGSNGDVLSDTTGPYDNTPMQQTPSAGYNCLFPGNTTFESLSNCYLPASYAIPPPPCGLNFSPSMAGMSMVPWTTTTTSVGTLAASGSHTSSNSNTSASTSFSSSQMSSWSSLNAAVGNLLPSELSPSQLEICMKAVVRSLQSELPASSGVPVHPKGQMKTESNASPIYGDVTPQLTRSQSADAANPEKSSLSDEDNPIIDLSSKNLMIESF